MTRQLLLVLGPISSWPLLGADVTDTRPPPPRRARGPLLALLFQDGPLDTPSVFGDLILGTPLVFGDLILGTPLEPEGVVLVTPLVFADVVLGTPLVLWGVLADTSPLKGLPRAKGR